MNNEDIKRQIEVEEECAKSHQDKADELRKRLKESKNYSPERLDSMVTPSDRAPGKFLVSGSWYVNSYEDGNAVLAAVDGMVLGPLPEVGTRMEFLTSWGWERWGSWRERHNDDPYAVSAVRHGVLRPKR